MVSGGGQGRLAGDWAGSGPPGALWRQARVGPLGSSGWASQGTQAEKVSLAGCHPQGSPIVGLTAQLAGWPSQEPRPERSNVHSYPSPCLQPSPWLCSPGFASSFTQAVTRGS